METNTIIITFAIAVVAVGLLVLGLSITLMRKGRPLQGDVGDNDEMKKLGLECTTLAAMREEAVLRGEKPEDILGCGAGLCSVCEKPKTECEIKN